MEDEDVTEVEFYAILDTYVDFEKMEEVRADWSSDPGYFKRSQIITETDRTDAGDTSHDENAGRSTCILIFLNFLNLKVWKIRKTDWLYMANTLQSF